MNRSLEMTASYGIRLYVARPVQVTWASASAVDRDLKGAADLPHPGVG